MSITFQCEHCGKAFDVDDRFAGKKGRCKQCGAVMLIPASPASRRSETISRDEASVEISPSRRPPSLASAAVQPKSRPPAEDVYGFDDLPGPPSRPGASPASDEPTLPARGLAKPRKKSAGFFSSSAPKKGLYPGGPTPGGALKRVVIGIALGLIGLLVRAVVIPAIQQGADPSWASRRVIESYMQGQIARINAATTSLRAVHDLASARAASPEVNATLKKLADQIRSHKDRKGKLTDIHELRAKYAADLARAESGLLGEVQRVMMVEGCWDALAIRAVIDEVASLSSDDGPDPTVGFAPPRFNPPRFNPPRFNPPPIPDPAFSPRPGIGPGQQPGPGPGFGPRNRSRGRGPGQPGPA